MINSTLSRILLMCSLCIVMSTVRAQYVAIPDSNFGKWLHANGYSACMTGNSTSGWHLDTTCTSVINATSIDCNSSSIINLTGIQYFKNLQTLLCYSNNLTSLGLGPLPSSLTHLECYFNQLVSLPSLNTSLQFLWCFNNQLRSLPTLPSALLTMDCSMNQLDSLPALPSMLQSLTCNGNQFTGLPTLPHSLTFLNCGNAQLTNLPTLPSSLTFLSVQGSPLASLPTLPTSLTQLICDNDHLSGLPTLPNSLTSLNCSYNQFTSLPTLPDSLISLDCTVNQLTSLPKLPLTLTTLNCFNNLLTSLPNLPNSLTSLSCYNNPYLSCLPRITINQLSYFSISNTGIQCVPNHFTALTYDLNPDSMPLCTPASGCDFYYNIAGNIHIDTAVSCSSDSINPGVGLGNVKVQLIHRGEVVQQLYTSGSGNYSFKTDSLTDYEVSIDTANGPFIAVCPQSGSHNVILSQADSVFWNESFGMSCSPGNDYGVVSISGHFRPTYSHQIYISAGNLDILGYGAGCKGTDTSGAVTTVLTGLAQYAGPAPGALTPSAVSGNVLTYNVAKLDSLNSNSLGIMVYVDSNAVIGDLICFTVVIDPSNPYEHADTLTECFAVQNSYDPNNKSVSPAGNIDTGSQWLTYTVEFQNTGTDTAYTVIVKDTLSPNIDASTFQYLASSNKAVIQLFGNAMVFTFPKINLVDSATNPPLSVGWIQYKVKSLPNLPVGSQIKNTAYIYFDNNPAVVTNTTVNVVDTPTTPLGIRQVLNTGAIHLYPNPNSGTFTLLTSGSAGSDYIITDMLGHVIAQHAITADRQTINMSDAARGVYTLLVQGAQPVRFVVVR